MTSEQRPYIIARTRHAAPSARSFLRPRRARDLAICTASVGANDGVLAVGAGALTLHRRDHLLEAFGLSALMATSRIWHSVFSLPGHAHSPSPRIPFAEFSKRGFLRGVFASFSRDCFRPPPLMFRERNYRHLSLAALVATATTGVEALAFASAGAFPGEVGGSRK